MTKYKLVDFKVNRKGFEELFKSEAMQRVVDAAGSDIAGKASRMSGETYGHRTHLASHTAISNVYPDGEEARKDNLKHNTLLKATGGYLKTKPEFSMRDFVKRCFE